jgi:hypothetical protein
MLLYLRYTSPAIKLTNDMRAQRRQGHEVARIGTSDHDAAVSLGSCPQNVELDTAVRAQFAGLATGSHFCD